MGCCDRAGRPTPGVHLARSNSLSLPTTRRNSLTHARRACTAYGRAACPLCLSRARLTSGDMHDDIPGRAPYAGACGLCGASGTAAREAVHLDEPLSAVPLPESLRHSAAGADEETEAPPPSHPSRAPRTPRLAIPTAATRSYHRRSLGDGAPHARPGVARGRRSRASSGPDAGRGRFDALSARTGIPPVAALASNNSSCTRGDLVIIC